MPLISKNIDSEYDCIPINEEGKNILIGLNENEAALERRKQFWWAKLPEDHFLKNMKNKDHSIANRRERYDKIKLVRTDEISFIETWIIFQV